MQADEFVSAAKQLLARQKKNWDDCARGYESLKRLKVKTFDIFGSEIKIQWNAGRITSTSAKVDDVSVKERKCFLCKENRPQMQEEIEVGDYLLLVNPFPIFPDHFTVAHKVHQPQTIENNIHSLLYFAKLFAGYCACFYNGPKCGASAPDHLHFQAGTKKFMPIETELHLQKDNALDSIQYKYGNIYFIDDRLRKYLLFEFSDIEKLGTTISSFVSSISPNGEEAMMNIHCQYDCNEKKYRLFLFLREKHRPKKYFSEGDDKLLLSPASVDVGGVCILPREEDFNKINQSDLTEIFQEVFITKEKLMRSKDYLLQ